MFLCKKCRYYAYSANQVEKTYHGLLHTGDRVIRCKACSNEMTPVSEAAPYTPEGGLRHGEIKTMSAWYQADN